MIIMRHYRDFSPSSEQINMLLRERERERERERVRASTHPKLILKVAYFN